MKATKRPSVTRRAFLEQTAAAAGAAFGAPHVVPGSALGADETAGAAGKVFRAGAHAVDITPTEFPVIVNCYFKERMADSASDPLHARCLVLDDGLSRLAIVVVDSCMMPRDLLDEAKLLASKATGIPTDHILVSATHTHSAPSAMGILGSRADQQCARALPGQIAKGIELAVKNLAPARIGWAVAKDFKHTYCRRWLLRPDALRPDPFGERSDRAVMHPGYQNPKALGPSAPVDPDLSVLSVQSVDGRPIAVLANYSMHYYGATPLSADWCGRFAEGIKQLIGAGNLTPSFVGIMSQGTSGDLMWGDYSKPSKKRDIDAYSREVAEVAFGAYKTIQYQAWVPLAMCEKKLTLKRRAPDAKRLAWARKLLAEMGDRKPKGLPEYYAREQIFLHEKPTCELKLQAIRIGELGITAMPNEVYSITGLKLKTRSPLQSTLNIELANGAAGYIPPPEQHKLGGYSTWEARSAGLEVQAEPKIVETLLTLLEEVSGRSRRKPVEVQGPYVKAVLASKPITYWRLGEFKGPRAVDTSGHGNHGTYEDGIAFYLEGPASAGFSGKKQINRAPHFIGGRMKADLAELGSCYSVEMWFSNYLPNDARAVTGYLFSRGADGAKEAPGDHLGIGGTVGSPGRLIFWGGNKLNRLAAGETEIQVKTWNHVAMVRDGDKLTVYLNGVTNPEISRTIPVTYAPNTRQVFVGGRNDNFANFEGRIDEVAVYNRALMPEEVAAHFKAAKR